MEGKMVEHWQHGEGMIVSLNGDDAALVLFEKDNRERVITLANLTDEAGRPLVSQKPVGRVNKELKGKMATLYEYIASAGKPVFTDYPSAPRLIQELNSRGADFDSAGTVSSYASNLKKRGFIRYAEGVKGSGWIAVQGYVE